MKIHTPMITDHIIRQNEIYSQAAYGAKNIWEIYARIGVSDLKISDVFSSTDASTTTNKNDFAENWKFFGTLGAKGFYPINETFGIGAFIQGTYYFSNFTDDVAGTSGSAAFHNRSKGEKSLGCEFRCRISSHHSLRYKVLCGPLYLLFGGKRISCQPIFPALNTQPEMFPLRTSPLPVDLQESIYRSPKDSV